MTKIDPRPTLHAPDDDPYLWLEDIDGEKALAWVAQQSARTLTRFAGPQFEGDRDELTAVFDRTDQIPLITRRGQYVYNFWQDAENPRGLWRRTTLAAYLKADPAWETLLDLDLLASEDGEDWIWSGATIEPARSKRAVLCLSRGGSDAVVHREFDLASLSFVADGFNLPEAKGDINWLDPDTLLLSSAFGEGMATRSGYARTVRQWKRGWDPLTAPVSNLRDRHRIPRSFRLSGPHRRERAPLVHRELMFFETIVWMGDRSGPKMQIDVPRDAWWDIFGDWLAIKPHKPWTMGGMSYAADALIGMSLSSFIAGQNGFTTLFEPSDRRSLQSFFWNDGKLVIFYLDKLVPRFEMFTPGRQEWTRRVLDTVPAEGTVHVWPFDADRHETNGEVLVSVQDPVTPPQLLLFDISAASHLSTPVILKRNPENFDVSGLVVTRHEAVSTDGEMIPYTQVGPANGNGDAPVHLTAYGGFGISVPPYYDPAIGKLWLEPGGTSAVANIRGGGEFGTRWHEAGRREGKCLAHDDFAAVAANLVRRGVTQPKRIAAEGGSLGGLLIANMLTRYSERFGALFCTIPLVDMCRYTKLLAGASWIDEYGDPDKPEDWADGREASGTGLSCLLLRSQRRRARLRQRQSRTCGLHRPRLRFPSRCNRFCAAVDTCRLFAQLHLSSVNFTVPAQA